MPTAAGQEMEKSVFSDFAKSLREMQGVDTDLSGETGDSAAAAAATATKGGVEDVRPEVQGDAGTSNDYAGESCDDSRDNGDRESKERTGVHMEELRRGDDGVHLDAPDSLVIEEADMEVGGYARAREELRRSKDAAVAAAVGALSPASRTSEHPASAARRLLSDQKSSRCNLDIDAVGAVGVVKDVRWTNVGQRERGPEADEKEDHGVRGGRRLWEGSDGNCEGSRGSRKDDAQASIAEMTGPTDEVRLRQDGVSSRGRGVSPPSPALRQSCDESYEDEGFEPDEEEDKGHENCFAILPERHSSIDPFAPSAEAAASGRRTEMQSSDVFASQRMLGFATTTPTAATDECGALQSTASRESTASFPPAPPTSPPPQDIGSQQQHHHLQARIVVRVPIDVPSGQIVGKHERGGPDYITDNDRPGDGGAVNVTAADAAAAVVTRAAAAAQMSPPPSPPPPPPPSHLPEDEVALDREDNDGEAAYFFRYGGGQKIAEATGEGGEGEAAAMADRWQHDASTGTGGDRRNGSDGGDGEPHVEDSRVAGGRGRSLNDRQQGGYETRAITATQDITPSFLRQRSRGHDDASFLTKPMPASRRAPEESPTGIRIPSAGPAAAIASTNSGYSIPSSHHRIAACDHHHNQQTATTASSRRASSANPTMDSDSRERMMNAAEIPAVVQPAIGASAESIGNGGGRRRGILDSDGPWDIPTAAPSLAELEYQLRKLNPLRASNKSDRKVSTAKRPASHTRARWKTTGNSPVRRNDAKLVGGRRGRVDSGGGGGEDTTGFSAERKNPPAAVATGGSRPRRQPLMREDLRFGGRGPGATGVVGGAFGGDDGGNPAGEC